MSARLHEVLYRLLEATLLFKAVGRSAAHVRRHAQSELELHLVSNDVASVQPSDGHAEVSEVLVRFCQKSRG